MAQDCDFEFISRWIPISGVVALEHYLKNPEAFEPLLNWLEEHSNAPEPDQDASAAAAIPKDGFRAPGFFESNISVPARRFLNLLLLSLAHGLRLRWYKEPH